MITSIKIYHDNMTLILSPKNEAKAEQLATVQLYMHQEFL